MPDLFRLTNEGHVAPAEEERFANEVNDLEGFVFDNPQLLGEGMKSVAKQVACEAGRIDIIAVDTSQEPGRVVIVELKNESAGVDVLLQVLRYASWVMANPDSVRLILQQKQVTEADVEFDTLHVVVAAPEIRKELVELSRYVVDRFEFEFVEIHRFKEREDQFVILNRVVPPDSPPAGASPQEEWTWDKYRDHFGWSAEQVELGKTLFKKIQEIIQSEGWTLNPAFRKSYVPFQFEGKNVVGLERRWAKGFSVWFKLPQLPEELHPSIPEDSQRYWDKNYNMYYVNIVDPDFDASQLKDMFEQSYAYIAGTG